LLFYLCGPNILTQRAVLGNATGSFPTVFGARARSAVGVCAALKLAFLCSIPPVPRPLCAALWLAQVLLLMVPRACNKLITLDAAVAGSAPLCSLRNLSLSLSLSRKKLRSSGACVDFRALELVQTSSRSSGACKFLFVRLCEPIQRCF
jgi:hypothetical protein